MPGNLVGRTNQFTLTALAALNMFLALGCRDRPPPPAARGSAEEEVGTLTPAAAVDGYVADLVPFLPTSVGSAPTGTLFLGQPQDFAIRVFDSMGREMTRIGGDGEGPGEFRAIMRLGTFLDSLWVWDGRLRRVSVFSPGDLRYVRSMRAPARIDAIDASSSVHLSSFAIVTLLDDDEFLALGDDGERSVLVRSSSTGTDGRILAVLIKAADVTKIRSGNTTMEANQFPSLPFFAVSPDRAHVVHVEAYVDGDRADTFDVTSVTTTGDTVFSRTLSFEPDPIPAAIGDSVIAERAARLPGPMAAAFRNQAYVPPAYPPITGVSVGWDGSIWIRLRDSEDSVTYTILSQDGNLLGQTQLSAGEVIIAVGADFVWTMTRDSLDVQSLTRYARGM